MLKREVVFLWVFFYSNSIDGFLFVELQMSVYKTIKGLLL